MKKFLILLISIMMIVFSGCGNDNKATDNTNQNSNVTQESRSAEPPVSNEEIFVGKSDATGRDCYLLVNSIKVYNNEKNLDCTIKMVKSDNDVQFLNYKFTLNGQNLFFETNQGFSGEVNPTETPIEHKTWDAAINNYVKMKEEKGKKSNIANNENKGSRPSEPPAPTGTLPSKISQLPSIGATMKEFTQNFKVDYEEYVGEYTYHIVLNNDYILADFKWRK